MSKNIRGERTRAEVLDAAWDLISEKGADVSVSKIAAAAGVTRQTIYLHFGSRGGLLMALVRRADERFEIKERFDAALALDDPKARLEQTLQAWLTFVPKIFPVAKDLIRLRATDPEADAAWSDRMDELRSWLLDLTRSLERDGALKAQWSPESASRLFWAQTSVQVWEMLKRDCGCGDADVAEIMRGALTNSLLNDDDRRPGARAT